MHQVAIEKDFPVAVSQLYKAWTEPESLKQWWHPMGNELIEVHNELQPGGTVQYIFETGGEKEKIEISGEYETVEPEQRLVYSWNWQLPQAAVGNGHYKLTVGFSENGSGSRLSVLQENFDSEEAIQPHREGWERALQDLASYLSENATQ